MFEAIKYRISTYDGWAVGAARVDQLADGVGVVSEVWSEVLERARVAVAPDEIAEVVGDDGGLVVGHAWSSILVARIDLTADGELAWGSQRGNGEKAGGDGERAHFLGIRGIRFLVLEWYRPRRLCNDVGCFKERMDAAISLQMLDGQKAEESGGERVFGC